MTGNSVAMFVPLSFGDMAHLAEAVAKSRMFGITTTDQALVLMAIAQAEGLHPALAARDYHIINNSPSKKAEAMHRDFLTAGGKIEWIELTDEAVEAKFSHPLGGSATIRWDNARCKQAQLTGGNHGKFPRQMKRARVVSEGVRTVWPLATSGMYAPEEAAEFAPQGSAQPADTSAALDAFAARNPAKIIDAETGEVLDHAAIERDARSAAACGTDALRDHLGGISREARASLKDKIGNKDAPGELLVLATRTDDALRDAAPDEGPTDAFGLPLSGEPHTNTPAGDHVNIKPRRKGSLPDAAPLHAEPPQLPAGGDEIADMFGGKSRPPSCIAKLPERPNSDDWEGWYIAINAMIEAGDPRAAILRDNKENIGIFEQVDSARHNRLMRELSHHG